MSPLFHVPGVTFGLWADAAKTLRRSWFGRGDWGLVARVMMERLCPNEVRALASAARIIGGAGPVLAGVRLVMPLWVQVPGGSLGLKANTSYARRHLRCRMASWGLLPFCMCWPGATEHPNCCPCYDLVWFASGRVGLGRSVLMVSS